MITKSFPTKISLIVACLLISASTWGQQQKNLFTQYKGKTKTPSSSYEDEAAIDGRLHRQDIFQSAPLFNLNRDNQRSIYAPGSSTPVWIETKNTNSTGTRLDARMADPKSMAIQYLASVSNLIRIKNADEEFDVISVKNKGGETHIKLQQKYHGVPVEGSQIYLHFTQKATILNGRYIPTPSLHNTSPGISAQNSIATSVADLKKANKYRELNAYEKQLLEYTGPVAELVFYRKDINSDHITLAWKVNIRPNPLDHFQYIIDASTGQTLDKHNHTCTAGPGDTNSTATDLNGKVQKFHTHSNAGKYYMIDVSKPMFNAAASDLPDEPVGAIWTIDAKNTDLTTFQQITSTSPNNWDPKAVSAHRNADSCYMYYKNVLGRNSLDNQNGTIISVINVTDGGESMGNAYWNGKFMAYGNGDQIFKPLAGGLDVAAHEMTHGVIQHEANLNYQGQSGAMNESMADIFGTMVDRDDWHMGEDIMQNTALSQTYFPTGYLRDLSNPHNGGTSKDDPAWQPMHMNEFVNTIDDNGGVHTNSGIPNHAFYLFATAIGKDKAERVFYKALTDYLVASSQFIDLRLAVIQASTDLYDATVANAARAAFDQVGIVTGAPTNNQYNLPVNPGADYILVTGLDENPNSLYNVDPLGSTPISSTRLGNKPSVTDNGSTAYFVDINGRIIRKNLTSNQETVADNTKIWDNVAVSKDGQLLAAVTNEADSSIFVKPSSPGGTWKRFILYKPTYSDSIFSRGPQYADALEWDYSGRRVMFDCYNLTVSNTNDTIDYWTIGFINVWDKEANDYGDGRVRNLFDGLPEYISIGNPTFSKNSPYIIAFDFIDFESGSVSILGTNIETGDVGGIIDNNMLGFPSYSKEDDQLAFTTVFDLNQNQSLFDEDTSTLAIDLSPDKINFKSTGQLFLIKENSKIPVWYAKGTRVLGSIQASMTLSALNAYPNPFSDELNLDLTTEEGGEVQIEILDMIGRTVKQWNKGEEGAGTLNYSLPLSDLQTGTYIVKVKAGEKSGVAKIVKTR